MQRQATRQDGPQTVPPIVHEVLRSAGQPLDAATRAFMEQRFGHDFSRVRVHTDPRAAGSARAVSALAYTLGQHMVFSAGQYAPGTTAGKRLLAHELTHVVQQGETGGIGTQRLSVKNATDDKLEQEANDQAKRLTQGQSSGMPLAQAQSGCPILQRQADISKAPNDVGNCLLIAGSGHLLGLNYLFEQSRSTVSPADQADLADFARLWLEDNSQPEVNVHGYASVEGTQAFNWRLSCARAEAVKAVLMRNGVPEGKIVTIAHGEFDRIFPNRAGRKPTCDCEYGSERTTSDQTAQSLSESPRIGLTRLSPTSEWKVHRFTNVLQVITAAFLATRAPHPEPTS